MLSLPKGLPDTAACDSQGLTLLTILVPGPISHVSLVVVFEEQNSAMLKRAAAKVKASD